MPEPTPVPDAAGGECVVPGCCEVKFDALYCGGHDSDDLKFAATQGAPVPDAAEVLAEGARLGDALRQCDEVLPERSGEIERVIERWASDNAVVIAQALAIRPDASLTPAPGEGLTEAVAALRQAEKSIRQALTVMRRWDDYYESTIRFELPTTRRGLADSAAALVTALDRLTASPAPLPDDEER